MSPYYLDGDFMIVPKRYTEMYFTDLFEEFYITVVEKMKCSDGFLLNDKLEKSHINVEILKLHQRSHYRFDYWYECVSECPHLTFESFLSPFLMKKYIEPVESILEPDHNIFSFVKECLEENKDVIHWFVRLNWASPKDEHVSGKELKFDDTRDILSRILTCERTRYFLDDEKYRNNIVLRPWYDIPEDMEFRCFIRKNELRAVSQYKLDTFYPHLQDIAIQNEIKIRISTFYENVEKYIPYEDCVMDVVIWDDARITSVNNSGIFIIEFNQFGGETTCGAGLYNWMIDRKILYEGDRVDLRILDHESDLQKFAREIEAGY
jgi:hypothetical protein